MTQKERALVPEEQVSLTASASLQSSTEIMSTIGTTKTKTSIVAIKRKVGPGPRQPEIIVTADTQDEFRRRLEEVVDQANRTAKETGGKHRE